MAVSNEFVQKRQDLYKDVQSNIDKLTEQGSISKKQFISSLAQIIKCYDLLFQLRRVSTREFQIDGYILPDNITTLFTIIVCTRNFFKVAHYQQQN